ncbi:class C beta-lactamase [Brucella haematophila]|uniref:class C beta-lactamase n=1 Tax=Brucella haematophila TaxID=419474 RepID=UPI00110EB4F6|nr:class C beta-lactamase [Brucella haematophila]TMV01606.1 beta-lactamase [Brucella haematophila]
MRKITVSTLSMVTIASLLSSVSAQAAGALSEKEIRHLVDETIKPVMTEHKIPGMAVAVTAGGETYFFGYGVASKESGQKVTEDTIFEIGSVSKTFTATLGGLGLAEGAFKLGDPATKFAPELASSGFDKVSMLDLGTYTAGGLPLQFPDSVTDHQTMIDYFKNWKPDYPAGTQRRYSNPSIGLFGYLAAQSMGEPFDKVMENKLIPAFGLKHTFIRVPESQMKNYAYGYSKANKPIRVSPGAFDAQAYGIKTTAPDLIRFVQLNMDSASLDQPMQKAVAATHTGYYKVGDMTQSLGWERYTYPLSLKTLLGGNTSDMAMKSHKIERLDPPMQPSDDMLLNKTGSTGGFGAYVAFVPAKKIGIVMLANRNYPNEERIKAGYRILKALDGNH